jgi:SAM-dependent methyltransferase
MITNKNSTALTAVLVSFVSIAFGFDQIPDSGNSEFALAQIRREAQAVRALVRSPLATEFLAMADSLPSIAPRTIYRTADKSRYFRESDVRAMPETERAALEKMDVTEEFYYTTKYGTPIAYARPIEILGAAGLESAERKRILDFGYGTIGHLRMLAGLGAEVVGVDVDPLFPALYGEPGDQGPVTGTPKGAGMIKLVHGRWPAELAVNLAIGASYDLIISKNTLKNGYIHPAEPVDERKLVKLGVDDDTFVRALFSALKPGGRVLIYNLCPAPAPPGKPYIPWADGRSPFSKDMWGKAGFKVLAFDVDDSTAARAMARTLRWDKGESPMDVENDLFALYTLVEKP